MSFVERWFSIFSEEGRAEVVIMAAIFILTITSLMFRRQLGSFLLWYLEQLGKRESGDRFDA